MISDPSLPPRAAQVRGPLVTRALRLGPAAVGLSLAIGAVQAPVWGWANHVGVPRVAVRAAGFLDVALVAVVVVVASVGWVRSRRRPDVIDAVALGLLAVVGTVLVVGVVGRLAGWDLAMGKRDVFAQVQSAQAIGTPAALLVAARTLDWTVRQRAMLLRLVAGIGVLLAVAALVEVAATPAWEWLDRTFWDIRAYQRDVLGLTLVGDPVTRDLIGGRVVVRAGSLLFRYLEYGFVLIPALLVALERSLRPRATWWRVVAGLLGVGIVLSLGRAAVAATIVAVGVVLPLAVARGSRRRLVAAVAAVAVVLAALAVPTGLVDRVRDTLRGDDASAIEHVDAVETATRLVASRPLGYGAGAGLDGAVRGVPNAFTAENAYLDVGLQVGVIGMGLLAALLVLVVVGLVRARPREAIHLVAIGSVVALAVGGLVLHTWTMAVFARIVLALAAAGLPRGS